MKIQEAKQLIKQTFENAFNKDQFVYFVNNLLKSTYERKTFIQTGAQLPIAYAEYFRKMERIGKYEDNDGNIIDLLVVELKKGHSVERARSSQRNFIRRYLNGSRGGQLKDAALVAFYSEKSEDWRFSLIRMQYSLEKRKEEFTPAKRFSFLVGKNEMSHTAQKQLTNLLTMDNPPSLSDIESSFNIESVTKEFFEKYKNLFLKISENLEDQFKQNPALTKELNSRHVDCISFTKKLLGQIVFLYFLQKKGWLGVPKNANWGEGDRRYLRTLFEKAIAKKQSFYLDYLQFLFYEALAAERRSSADPSYYKYLDCKIPFLNGGLFEADYDWRSIHINIPNDFFSNTTINREGDLGDGVLDIFDRYNFTVKEDEPLEKDVAVDPEMLGKVFENLLEIKDRKSKGAFYTPRDIVHYMCQESLISYLDTTLNYNPVTYQELGKEQIDMFGNSSRSEQLALESVADDFIKVPRQDLEVLLKEGASVINNDALVENTGRETKRNHFQLPERIRIYANEIDYALSNIKVCDPAIGSGAFPVGIMNEIVKTREILSIFLPHQENRSAYELKRHCIQENIYGVDIDHSAIDIAKLRLWLSLVVDEEDFFKIKPLPNLDYKIIRGDSLFGFPEGIVKNQKAENELEILKEEFFNETNHEKKTILREKINTTIEKILKTTNEFIAYRVDFDYRLFFSEVFHKNKGFDIVIGNPPYVSALGLKKILNREEYSALKLNYETAKGTVDLYIYFFEKGIKLLKKGGILSFISPNRYLSASYGEELRRFIYKNAIIHSIIDYSDVKVFSEASTYPVLTFIKNIKLFNYKILIGQYKNSENRIVYHQTDSSKLNSLTGFIWGFLLNDKISLTAKVLAQSEPLLNICKINATSTTAEADLYHSMINERDGYKLINTGTIDRYSNNWGKDYLTDKGEKYLHPFLPKNSKKISTNRHSLYASAKIILAKIALRTEAFFDENGEYASINTNCLHSFANDINPKYLLAWINSKLFQYIYECFFEGLKMQGGYLLYSAPNLSCMTIKKINEEQQSPFITLVDYIIYLKQKGNDDNISPFVPNDFIINYFDKIIDGCFYELFFQEHMKKNNLDIMKYLSEYVIPISPKDTTKKKSEVILNSFNALNHTSNIVRNRLLLFTSKSTDIILQIEKSVNK
jgi:hypothetical protein